MSSTSRAALVLSGGGARGAYEAGVLHYVRTALPPACRRARLPILCATSVGAVNAAFMASTADDPESQGARLRSLWEGVDESRVFRRDWAAVGRFVLHTMVALAGNFLRVDPGRRRRGARSRFVSLFDTEPFPDYLRSLIDFPRIERNLAEGHIDALTVAATSLDTDRTELFIQKRSDIVYRGDYRVHEVAISAPHVLASAAIPFAFPPVKIGGTYYCDGGVRLNTPMSPAIQLGADRILVIGSHARSEKRLAAARAGAEYPSPGRLIATVTEAVLRDKLRSDQEQLERVNRIIQSGQDLYGADFLAKLNARLCQLPGGAAIREIHALALSPSRDVSQLFRDQLRDNPYLDDSFSPFERFAMRLFAIDPREGSELFSYLVFAPRYVRALLDLGYEDARAHHRELVSFFTGERLPMTVPQILPANVANDRCG
jgi:NTE family protein